MKNVFPVFLVLVLSLSSCMRNVISGSGVQVTDMRSVKSFNAIEIGGAMDVTVNQQDGATPSIQLYGYENLLKYIKTEVKNNTLSVYTVEGTELNTDQKIKVVITLPSMSSLSLSGATDGVIHGIVKGNDFKLEVSGASDVVADNVSVTNFSTEISGAAKVKVNGGTVESANYELSGAAVLNAFNLVTNTTTVELSGTGIANVNAQKTLDAHLSGIGAIRYKGHPAVTSEKSGIGSIADAN
ncbi:MAG: DUF2807 domain-containing protein [Flavipsychrobacter sp.]|nr:DUF2807 domain-containing protein [Flavipsychrobacter sp.]